MLFHPAYLLLLFVPVLFGVWAESRARSVFQRYAAKGMQPTTTGADAADAVCRAGRLKVMVRREGKFLETHYDPTTKVLSLSAETYEGRSITSIAKGAYEAGHALQYAQVYRWFGLRSGLVPVANFVTRYSFWAILMGTYVQISARDTSYDLFASLRPGIEYVGAGVVVVAILLFVVVVLLQLAGLPVGMDASKRAKAALPRAGLPGTEAELRDVAKVLDATPWVYVGVALSAFVTVPYHSFMRTAGNGDARDSSLFM